MTFLISPVNDLRSWNRDRLESFFLDEEGKLECDSIEEEIHLSVMVVVQFGGTVFYFFKYAIRKPDSKRDPSREVPHSFGSEVEAVINVFKRCHPEKCGSEL